MQGERMRDAAGELLRQGWSLFGLTGGEQAAFGRLDAAAERFFCAPDEVRRLSQWSGDGMWAGYQPMPQGDPEVLDHVDRFETTRQAMAAGQREWPWASEQARRLRGELAAVNGIARSVIAASVREVCLLTGRDPQRAHALWCEGDESTLVVNSYRAGLARDGGKAVKMKPHADFGGLSLIFAADGLESLEFEADGGWRPVGAPAGLAGRAVILLGQLFAHWLGAKAPVHRVVQVSGGRRMSTVYFHQPGLDAVIDGRDGEQVVAGEHIAAMQAYYNGLGGEQAPRP